jgi:ketosteroid isomerase-like protein
MNTPKILRKLLLLIAAPLLALSLPAHEKGKHEPDAAPPAENADDADVAAVKRVLAAYKAGLESLDASGLGRLFTDDCEIFESGAVEGDFNRYLEHHIGPELGHFRELSFRDYAVKVWIEGDYAFATETYIYRIVFKDEERVIEKRGLATSILRRTFDGWKIRLAHNSSRNLRKAN